MAKTAIEPADVPPLGVYTPAFRLSDGEMVVCSGMVPVDERGETVGVGDPAAQTRQVLTNLQRLLEAANSSLADVVHLRVFSTDIDNREAINAVRRQFFAEPFPASTHLQVVRLVRPEWLVEIEATAFASYGGSSGEY